MSELGRKANPKNVHTQAVVFDSSKWDEKKAKAWCAKHGYVTDGLRKGEGSFAFYQYDPDKAAFRYKSKDLGNGVQVVMGAPMTSGKAEFADGVQYEWEHNPQNDTYTLKGVEVFSVGTWNGEPYSDDDLEQMAAADEALHDVLRPRIKIGHGEKGDESAEPAYGWLGPIKKVGKKLLADVKSIPAELFDAIKKGRYARQSVEIRLNYKHPETGKRFPFAIDALAFLGAKLPAVGTLKPLAEFENDGEGIWLHRDAEKSGDDAGESASPEQREFHHVETVDAEGDSMDEKEMREREDKLAAERKELETLREQAKADREAVDEGKRRLHADKIDGMATRLVEAGKATPGEVEEFKLIAGTLNDSDKLKFADGERTALEAFYRDWNARPDKAKNTKGSKKGAEPEVPEDVQVFFQEEAEKLMSVREGLSFADALGEVHKANPAVFEQYRAERMKPLHKRS